MTDENQISDLSSAQVQGNNEQDAAYKNALALANFANTSLSPDLKTRAQAFLEVEALQRQSRMEAISAKAELSSIPPEENKSAEVDEDWKINFLNKARDVSSAEMQTLWAQVLRREVTSPGSFSRRSVNILSELDSLDAKRFSTLCSYQWLFDGRPELVVLDPADLAYQEVSYTTLIELEALGLVRVNKEPEFLQARDIDKATFYQREVVFAFDEGQPQVIPIGNAVFTRAGRELSALCKGKEPAGIYEYVKRHWRGILRH